MRTKRVAPWLGLAVVVFGVAWLAAPRVRERLMRREVLASIEILRNRDLNYNDERRVARERLAQIGRPAVGPLIRCLDFDAAAPYDYEMPFQAAEVLAEIGPDAKAAIPKLVPLLDDHSSEHVLAGENLAMRCASTLGMIGEPALPAVLDALKSPDWRTRNAALWALKVMGPKAHSAIPAVVALFRDPDANVRSAAVDALGGMGPETEKAIPDLVVLLGDTETVPDSRPYRHATPDRAAAHVLGLMGDPAVPHLEKALTSEDPAVREGAKRAFAWIEDAKKKRAAVPSPSPSPAR